MRVLFGDLRRGKRVKPEASAGKCVPVGREHAELVLEGSLDSVAGNGQVTCLLIAKYKT